MSALTAANVATIREWIGSKQPPTDGDLQTIYTRKGSLRETIRSVLRQRLSDLTSKPATFNAEGDYSQSTAANIAALQKDLAELDGYPDNMILPSDDDGGLGLQSGRLKRVGGGGWRR